MATVPLIHIILRKLSEKPHTGYSLRKEIAVSTGHAPSFGSIYPILERFSKQKLVTVKLLGRRKVYTITELGKKQEKQTKEHRDKIIDGMIAHSRMFCEITGCDSDQMMAVLEQLKNDKDPLLPIRSNAVRLHDLLLQVSQDGRLQKHKQQINKILLNTIQKIEALK